MTKTKRANPEAEIHKAVVQHLRKRGAPGMVWWHTNNNITRGGKHGAIQGARAKAMGVLAGVSDLILVHAGHIYALELKADKGNVTDAQYCFLDNMLMAGARVNIAWGADDAIEWLEKWGLLQGRTIAMAA